MQKLRTQRGITLIALIITIIVMLILVGVSVTVALEGGLFTTAKEATNKTQLELDKEQLLELALGAIDKEGNVDPDKITADGRFTHADGVYTSKSGNKFTVSKWGSVAEAPVYELSGRWEFVNGLQPSDGENESIYVSQNISFSSSGSNYSSITVEHTQYGEEETYYLCVNYDNVNVFHGMTFGWVDNVDGTQYRTVDFGTTPQPVSEKFYTWFTANANQVETLEYELSGKWRFVENPEPHESDSEGIYVSQEISFTVFEEINYGSEEEPAISYEPHTFSSMRLEFYEYGDQGRNFYSRIYYNDSLVCDSPAGGWVSQPDFAIDTLIDPRELDFGGFPQEVSEEFYTWFTANASPVSE